MLQGELARVNRKLSEPLRDRLVPKPGTVRHAALAAVRNGRESLIDITDTVSQDLGRQVVKNSVANELRALRNTGLVYHADHRWYPVKKAQGTAGAELALGQPDDAA